MTHGLTKEDSAELVANVERAAGVATLRAVLPKLPKLDAAPEDAEAIGCGFNAPSDAAMAWEVLAYALFDRLEVTGEFVGVIVGPDMAEVYYRPARAPEQGLAA